MLKITLGGTGSPLPSPDRAGPMTIVESVPAPGDTTSGETGGDSAPASAAAPTRLMIDAGRGAVMRLTAAGLLPAQLDAVLLTHLHSDHICALNDIITTHWVMTQDGSHQLPIYGPARTQEMMDGLLAMLAPDIEFRISHHEDLVAPAAPPVTEVAPGDSFQIGAAASPADPTGLSSSGLKITVGRTSHAPVEPSVAYRVSDGSSSVVIAGDGIPCEELDELTKGADAYVQTVLRTEMIQALPSARLQDVLEYHSSVEDAAKTAARAGVSTLALTHYIPAMAPGTEAEWRDLAAAHFGGDIILGDDLTSFTI